MNDTVHFEIKESNGYYYIETKNVEWESFNQCFTDKKDLYFWMEQITTNINNHPITPMGVTFTIA